MVGEWKTEIIEDVAERVAMGPFGSSIKVETFVDEGVPVISGQHLHSVRLDETPGFNFVSEEHADRLKNANVQKGDVIFTHAGNIGQVAYIREDSIYDRYVISQRQFYMRCNRQRVIPEFVAYYFKSREGQHKLLANTSQVGVPSIAQPVSYLRTIPIPLPTLSEQRAIVHILGTLDDKIELNRRMNETLEEMARAIFKSWFVNFDPVRAKAEGRDPGLPEHIADLFPDRFEDSELGEIPAGWRIGTLGEVAENSRRGIQPTQIEESTPYMGLEHLPRQRIALADWSNAENIESNKFEFRRGEILFGKLRPYFHKVGVAPVDGVCSTDILVVAAKHPQWFAFVLEHVSSVAFIDYVDAASTGTKMPRTNWKDMAAFRLTVPPSSLAEAFNEFIQPLVDRIVANIHESRSLAALRDSLLPRLISGELRIGKSSLVGGTD
jgi:type I restriction enzyme S subunit